LIVVASLFLCWYATSDSAYPTMKNLLSVGALLFGAIGASARALGGSPKDWIVPYKREALQDIVSCGFIPWVGIRD
jgi:hypothetical protein